MRVKAPFLVLPIRHGIPFHALFALAGLRYRLIQWLWLR
jgi:hypothetical protein